MDTNEIKRHHRSIAFVISIISLPPSSPSLPLLPPSLPPSAGAHAMRLGRRVACAPAVERPNERVAAASPPPATLQAVPHHLPVAGPAAAALASAAQLLAPGFPPTGQRTSARPEITAINIACKRCSQTASVACSRLRACSGGISPCGSTGTPFASY